MNICRSCDAIEFPAPSVAGRACVVVRAIATRVAGAIASWRQSRAVPRIAPLCPDSRTLRDIGLTPMGISEEALAALNEAGRRTRARP